MIALRGSDYYRCGGDQIIGRWFDLYFLVDMLEIANLSIAPYLELE